ncbi:MAG: protein-L-isoaspartate O-methyltransferase [Burkholderiaceae bacterium]|jgi:protein-L-isoaspartate(D-aspartate) O-methyltransferase|uniref:protein-L-isoaspartate O-methyltransferase family protein n=1 Tax=Hylemonella sp. TaxID=2066020 RepID=UPI0035B31C1F|nr:protein-L-isoaspartate O-methyltransferase [Burkholderiaceae bacterium]
MNFEQARFNMIEQQIRPWNVLDGEILDLLSQVRREAFVPVAHQSLAFADLELPLRGNGENGQCMLAPKVEARMLQDLAVQKHEKVLEIGTGSGYMAALLAQRAQRVITLEIDAELANLARGNLSKAGITNVDVRQADGAKGIPADGPFDVIVLSGSVAEVPHKLLEQLKTGGRLMAIVGDAPVMRATLITRTSAVEYLSTQGWDTLAPRLLNFPEHPRFSF